MSEYNKEPELREEISKMLREQETQARELTQEQVKTQEKKEEVIIEKQEVSETQVSNEVLEEPQAYEPKDEWEEKAIKLGWDPDKKGDTAVPAREYVLRKPLFDRIEKQNRELREIKERQRQNDTILAQARRDAYEQALKTLETKRYAAVEEADVHTVRMLDLETKKLETSRQNDPIMNRPIEPVVDSEVQSFVERSKSWYNADTAENHKMKLAAEAIDSFLYKQAKLDQGLNINDLNHKPVIDTKAHTAAIEKEVKRMFPHRFYQDVNTQETVKPIPMVGKSTSRPNNSKSGTNLVNKLTPQQRELGEKFHKSNPEYTLEKYAQDLADFNRLGK